jgi:hypothetical protein
LLKATYHWVSDMRRRRSKSWLLIAFVTAVYLLRLTGGPSDWARSDPPASAEKEFTDLVRPLLTRYCITCHGGEETQADIDLRSFTTLADAKKAIKTWQKVSHMLDGRQMPPAKEQQPTEDERAVLSAWVRMFLKEEAKTRAGDPGPVILRRLTNAEYTYVIRDLTSVNTLDPAKEFPVDSAGGEGFTNTGAALVMSQTLLDKYLDAAKEIAAHAVLLPDGIRFSPHMTRPDWSKEILDRIRATYARYSDPGGTIVSTQGLTFDGQEGGRLPLEKYIAATLTERTNIESGKKTLQSIAKERGLSPKYLEILWRAFTGSERLLLLSHRRQEWRNLQPADASNLAAEIARWQNALGKFNSVGHIGKVNGPKAWLEPVDPLVSRQELRWKAPANEDAEVTFFLAATAHSDGNEPTYVVWDRPRFVAPGRPELLLRDARAISQARLEQRDRVFAQTAKYLQAADEAMEAMGNADIQTLAKHHNLDSVILQNWLNVLGIGASGPVKLSGHFTNRLQKVAGHSFVSGWGAPELPCVVANTSDQLVRIPGDLKGHGVAMHPSPTLAAVAGWQSPVAGTARIVAKVQHAHVGCGNGVAWAIDVRRGTTRQRLASGKAQGEKPPKIDAIDNVRIAVGDVVSVAIGANNGDHACDLTAVDVTITVSGQTWDLAQDVSANVLVGNPHADHFNNASVWHFFGEPETGLGIIPIPDGSLIRRWQAAPTSAQRTQLAAEIQKLLTSPPPTDKSSPDAGLRREIAALGGPLLANVPATDGASQPRSDWGVDPVLFGRHPEGAGVLDPANLCVKAPAVIEIKLPADLVAGYDFVTTGTIHSDSREHGMAQLQVTTTTPQSKSSLQPDLPIVVAENSTARTHISARLAAFRDVFPAALCYARIVPIDEAVTLKLYHREDQHFIRLMLNEDERRQLDQSWDELHYVSQSALTQVDAYRQLMEYATQDGDPKLFEPLREPTMAAAAAFRLRLNETEPQHLEGVLQFANRAYRRPLSDAERNELTNLYRSLRKQEVPHDEAIRLTLARILIAPAFLYRLEIPGPGTKATPITDIELANRLSFFLWSSLPDAELRAVATSGQLNKPDVLVAQLRRMVQDERVRRLAMEFGCQWLQVRRFEGMNEKSERHFPTFAGLRAAMYEETVLFFTDLFQNNRTVASLLDADATFLNESLARHYDIPGVTGDQWRRVEDVRKYGRGGILGLATTLATQSGASRTSPILRGNWVFEVLLGEKLPRPPKGVPQLPEDEGATDGLTVRELVERHSSDAKCAVCHKKIDAFGFALESFDPIGRRRDKDLGGRTIDARARTADGSALDGIGGLRNYLLTQRKGAFERQVCRKLLGYAVGRAVQLSDEPLLDDMQAALAANGGHISALLESIVRSRQFREIRGRQYPSED